MDRNIVNVAILGCGYRSCVVVDHLLKESLGTVRIASVFDPDKEVASGALEAWGQKDSGICDSYQEAIESDGIDWVMVFSPNAYHKEHIIHAFKCNKHVFAEKPLAVSIEDCQEVFDMHQQSDRLFATGFVLRYSLLYRKAKEILDSGRLGKIISIDANENLSSKLGGYMMSNWRRLAKYAGPYILEKCCHDIDLLNWYCKSLPSRVASFGGLNMFIPGHESLREKYGEEHFRNQPDPHAVDSPFTADTDQKDNLVSILEYRNNIRAMFQTTMSNAIPERRMYFSCTEGTMVLELFSGMLRYKCIG
ncbi:MAG: Gfo/Idh/MocA family oxidoreductase, partial [Verrucomicrobiota bacterium]